VDNLYEAEDYRAWMRSRYEERKKNQAHFSYRFMAMKLEMDAGQLVKILQGKLHLTPQKIPAVAKLFGLDARSERFLEALVRFSKATGAQEISRRWDEIQAMKEVQARELEQDQYEFYSTWLPTAVRGILSLGESDQTPKAIACRIVPQVDPSEVERTLSILSRLGLATRDDADRWALAHKHIRTGDLWREKTVRHFQIDTMRLASDALETVPAKRRDISTLTLTLAEKDLPLLKERVAEFRRDLVRLAEESDPADSVYQVNVQVFPMTAETSRNRRKGASA
jgi:uncharacterized protein (TIGR02147 family)